MSLPTVAVLLVQTAIRSILPPALMANLKHGVFLACYHMYLSHILYFTLLTMTISYFMGEDLKVEQPSFEVSKTIYYAEK